MEKLRLYRLVWDYEYEDTTISFSFNKKALEEEMEKLFKEDEENYDWYNLRIVDEGEIDINKIYH